MPFWVVGVLTAGVLTVIVAGFAIVLKRPEMVDV